MIDRLDWNSLKISISFLTFFVRRIIAFYYSHLELSDILFIFELFLVSKLYNIYYVREFNEK